MTVSENVVILKRSRSDIRKNRLTSQTLLSCLKNNVDSYLYNDCLWFVNDNKC